MLCAVLDADPAAHVTDAAKTIAVLYTGHLAEAISADVGGTFLIIDTAELLTAPLDTEATQAISILLTL